MKITVKAVSVLLFFALALTSLINALDKYFSISDAEITLSDDFLSASVNPPTDCSISVEAMAPGNIDSYSSAIKDIIDNISNLNVSFASRMNSEFIKCLGDRFGKDFVESLADALLSGKVNSSDLHSVVGYTEKALISIIDNDLERTTVLQDTGNGVADFVFVGDCSFADGYSLMYRYHARGKGVEGIVSEEVLNIMRSASVAMANNEFTFTTRGEPVPNKKFTFRAKPKNVSLYHEMGVDIVGLANNHAFDYGPDSLTDTLATLDGASINHVGAGENIDDAKAPYYYIVNGYKVAIIAGTAIDLESTQFATKDQSGVFQIYDTVSMTKAIAAAKKNADYVVAYVHWGVESTTELTSRQKRMGKAFVDAGADLVVGMHSHCMQGIEYYNGKLIVYSLGNFAFSSYDLTAAMLKMSINADGEIVNTFYPMMQKDCFTYITSDEEKITQLKSLRELSVNVTVSDNFIVTESN